MKYEQFWENPFAMPIMWIGLLFTIIGIAHQFQQLSNGHDKESSPFALSDDSEFHQTAQMYREKIVQCLVLGQYTKGGPYTIETLLQYFAIENFMCKDADTGIWLVRGIIVNLAMRMGLHRDPQHFPSISPFAGEMRRRLWTTVYGIDLIISAQVGLPRMIKDSHVDTLEPHNLLDTDFDEDTKELPPSRPEMEQTPVLALIAKYRAGSVISVVADVTTDTRPYSYEEIMKIDEKIQSIRQSLPPFMRWKGLGQSIMDPPQIVLRRIYLEVIILRGQIMLNRKFLTSTTSHDDYVQARKVCVKAAMQILEYHHLVNEEVQSGGRLYGARFLVSAVVNHDFLLATSILCYYLRQKDGVGDEIDYEKVITLLTKSYEIWQWLSANSKEAQKAADALSFILSKPAGVVDLPASTAGVDRAPSPIDMAMDLQAVADSYGPLSFYEGMYA